jgi:hypothetical protein
MARSGQFRLPTQFQRYDGSAEQRRNAEIERHFRDHYSIYELDEIHQTMLQWVADNFNSASYAGMIDDVVSFIALGAGWTPLDNYDRDSVTPKRVTTDLLAGTVTFDHIGTYRINVNVNLSHDQQANSRKTNVRLFNVTDATALPNIITMSIGDNQTATNIAVSSLMEIDASNVNKSIRVELGGGDAVSNITGVAFFDVNMVSEWRETLPNLEVALRMLKT